MDCVSVYAHHMLRTHVRLCMCDIRDPLCVLVLYQVDSVMYSVYVPRVFSMYVCVYIKPYISETYCWSVIHTL